MHGNTPFGPVHWRHAERDLLLRSLSWRILGEVQRSGTVAPGHEKYESGLRDRRLGYLHAMQLHPSVAAPASLSAFTAWQFRERCVSQRRVQLGAPSKRPDSIRMRKPVVTSVVTNGPAICRPGPGAWRVPRAGDVEHHPQSLVALSLS
jgi:hypothetical protein